ncbi:MAG: hypothetical protein WBA16_02000 [Nonlabens sp.]
MSLNWNKAKQYVVPTVKYGIVIACSIMIYIQLHNKILSPSNILDSIKSMPLFLIPLMCGISLLSWLVESKKWQLLVNDFYGLRFRESVIQNITSQAASFITPFRSGEYGLKALYFPAHGKKTVMDRTLVGNMSQMMVTVGLGLIGLVCYVDDPAYLGSIVVALLFVIAAVALSYRWIKNKYDITSVHPFMWMKTVGYSMLRYMIFSANWILALSILEVPLYPLDMLIGVAVFYLVVSILPLMQLLDIPVRLAVASFVFLGVEMDNQIVVVTGLVWISNTLFPTLLGCLLLPAINFKALQL